MKAIIYDADGHEHVVGQAKTWAQVHEVCLECRLPIHPVGAEGPDAFYVTAPRRDAREFWPPRTARD